ncbi:MAG: trypsin-like peptidase domain-containing protein [Candidatus Marinimicrobia bacterium]|nr:trypsin-like peptidase domain-containing protein [Candidatus Neomarinimicrobiota bacterium]
MKQLSKFIIILLVFIGCQPIQYKVRPGLTLNAYKYVYVTSIKTDPYNTHSLLSSLFKQEGFKVVSKNEISSLPSDEKIEVLVCKYSYMDTGRGTGAMIQLSEHLTNSVIFTSANEHSNNESKRDEILGAIRKAFSGIAKEYSGYSPKAVQYYEQKTSIHKTKKELEKYYDENTINLAPIEGIWSEMANRYTLGIFKDTLSSKRDFVAIILNSEDPSWLMGEIKIEFLSTVYPTVYTTTYYLVDKSKQGTTSRIIDKGILEIALRDPKTNLPFAVKFIKNYPRTEWSYSEIRRATIEKPELPVFSSKSDLIKRAIESAVTIKTESGHGSGVIISREGYAITNAHVIEDNFLVDVIFSNGLTLSAKILYEDSDFDLALLKISGSGFQALPLGNSDNLKIGEDVYAIGTPFGLSLGQSVSKGIISGVRSAQNREYIQTDVPINPGNSGGPIINGKGEILGIVTIKLIDVKYEGLAFCIPSNTVKEKLGIVVKE